MTTRCAKCTLSTTNICRVCDTCLEAGMIASRAAQGLPPTITDPKQLATIASAFEATDRTRAALEAVAS